MFPILGQPQIVRCTPTNINGVVTENDCDLEDFQNMIGNTYNILLDYAGILAVFFFIIGGIVLITSGGNAERIKRGRIILGGVLVGVSIVLLSYLIVDFVTKTLQGGP